MRKVCQRWHCHDSHTNSPSFVVAHLPLPKPGEITIELNLRQQYCRFQGPPVYKGIYPFLSLLSKQIKSIYPFLYSFLSLLITCRLIHLPFILFWSCVRCSYSCMCGIIIHIKFHRWLFKFSCLSTYLSGTFIKCWYIFLFCRVMEINKIARLIFINKHLIEIKSYFTSNGRSF